MTCREFQEVKEKGLFLCTRAERAALSNHLCECSECLDRLLGAVEGEMVEWDKLSDGEKLIMSAACVEIAMRDRLDPEAK